MKNAIRCQHPDAAKAFIFRSDRSQWLSRPLALDHPNGATSADGCAPPERGYLQGGLAQLATEQGSVQLVAMLVDAGAQYDAADAASWGKPGAQVQQIQQILAQGPKPAPPPPPGAETPAPQELLCDLGFAAEKGCLPEARRRPKTMP